MVERPTGHKLLAYGITSLLVGHVWVRRLVRIKV
jgi:Flp pilus assembly protein TadB